MTKIIIAILFILPSTIWGQTFTMPVRVNLDKSMRADRAPMMKLDRAGNIYIAWISGADGNGNGPISMAISNDGGETFSNQAVCSDAVCNSNFQRTAQFVIDTKSNIHLVWTGNRVNAQPDIWYTRSTDQGKSWTVPVSISDADDSSKYAQDFPSIACDSNDNLYVSYLDSRETQRMLSPNVHLYLTTSNDGGKSWSMHKKADVFTGGIGGTCECCAEKIACSPEGNLFIVFRSNINNVRDIWLARSTNRGISFEPPLKIVTGDWNINACPVSGPNIAIDRNSNAHIVWRDSRDDSAKIHLYYAFVPSASVTTPANQRFDAEGSQAPNYADIAISPSGNFRIIAYETFNYDMRYILVNGATPLVNNRPFNVNAGTTKSFASIQFGRDSIRYVCWQDSKSDAGDIYFMKEVSSLVVSPTNQVQLTKPVDAAQRVVQPITFSWSALSEANSYEFVLAETSNFMVALVDSLALKTTNILLKTPLVENQTYYWHVRENVGALKGSWSQTWSFTAHPLAGVRSQTTTTDADWSFYPMPLHSGIQRLHIIRSSDRGATLVIYDLNGKALSKIPLSNSPSQVVTIPHLASGTYYLDLGEASPQKKLIVAE
ncbi:MAG: T9SS type A sorting domain-containing protein [bacterium]